MKNTLDKIINYGLLGLVGLLPLFFLPLTSDVFSINKLALLLGGTLILTALCIINSLLKRQFKVVLSAFDIPVVLMAISYLATTFLRSPNRNEAFWGETGLVLGASLLYFLLTHRFNRNRQLMVWPVATSGFVLALAAVYQYMGVGQAFFQNTLYEAKSFTPAGNLLTLAIFLAGSLLLSLRLAFSKDSPLLKTLLFAASGLQLVGLIVAVYQLLPGQPAQLYLLPFTAGWQIAADILKGSPFFGVGPNNFLAAFTANKPLFLNYSDAWQTRFLRSSNWPLQILTTTGLLGLGSWVILVLTFMRNYKKTARSSYGKTFTWLTGGLLLISLTLPINFTPVLILLYVGLAMMAAPQARVKEVSLPKSDDQQTNQVLRFTYFGLSLILVAGLLYPLYPLGKTWAAEYYFRKSLQAAAQNDGGATYNYQLKALTLNPRNLSVRLAFSQTNLALAQSLASQENPTDQTQQNIIQLVQQSIAEAKNAVAVNPQNITAWENLATIYRNLINFAQGADQWAISALTQAVSLDPTNPLLRVQLGGLYYALQDYDAAQRVFEQAISAKSDYANAYYNLGVTLEEQNKLQKAALAYQQTLNLLPENSPDRNMVKERLTPIEEEVQKQVEAQQAQQQQVQQQQQAQITEPEPLPEQPSGFEPIMLDEEEAAPPEVSPTATPTPIPTENPETE